MILRFLLLVPYFTKKETFKQFMEFFNNTQVFHPMYSMLYNVNLGLCNYVPFSQIWSQILFLCLLSNSQKSRKIFFTKVIPTCVSHMIKTHGSESRGQEAQSTRPQNNKHATTTVSHLHEGSIMQSFEIRMAKSQPY